MLCSIFHKKIETKKASIFILCGKKEVRPPEPVKVNGFQDRRNGNCYFDFGIYKADYLIFPNSERTNSWRLKGCRSVICSPNPI